MKAAPLSGAMGGLGREKNEDIHTYCPAWEALEGGPADLGKGRGRIIPASEYLLQDRRDSDGGPPFKSPGGTPRFRRKP